MSVANELVGLVREFGPWVGYGVLIVWGLEKSGAFRWLWRVRHAIASAENKEREILSADWQSTLVRHENEIGRLRSERLAERAADKAECEARIAAVVADYSRQISQLREECEADRHKWLAITSSQEAGNRRWRHLAMNAFAWMDGAHALAKKAGIELPPFEGWKTFIAEGGDLPFDPQDYRALARDG